VMAFALALCWVWVLLALLVKSPQSLQGFGFIVLFPLTFGSNVFVPTGTLPGWLQAWVKINPVTYLSDAVRGLWIGGPVANAVWHSLAWTVAILVVFAPLAVTVYRRRA
jgi:oleandomycin transport system permease protein